MHTPNKEQAQAGRLAWLLLLAAWLIFVPHAISKASNPGQAEALATELPTRPDPIQLPERPKQKPEGVKGGYLDLQITPMADIWTEVEWQGGDGSWHVVEGWRGYTTVQGAARWFVEPSELGKGPFRWQIYLYEGGDLLLSSAPFTLPQTSGEKVVVKLTVPELAVYLY